MIMVMIMIIILKIIAAAASEPEANERGSPLISRRLHYRGLQSLFLTKRKKLWLFANGEFRMRSGMRKELWLCANEKILGCALNHVLSCHEEGQSRPQSLRSP